MTSSTHYYYYYYCWCSYISLYCRRLYTAEHHYIQSGWLSPIPCVIIYCRSAYKVKSWCWGASVFNDIFIKIVISNISRDARHIMPLWPNVKHMWRSIILLHYYYSSGFVYTCVFYWKSLFLYFQLGKSDANKLVAYICLYVYV